MDEILRNKFNNKMNILFILSILACSLLLKGNGQFDRYITLPLSYTPLSINQLYVHARKLSQQLRSNNTPILESG